MKKLRICTLEFENGTKVNIALEDTQFSDAHGPRLKTFDFLLGEAKAIAEKACEFSGRGRCLCFLIGETILVP